MVVQHAYLIAKSGCNERARMYVCRRAPSLTVMAFGARLYLISMFQQPDDMHEELKVIPRTSKPDVACVWPCVYWRRPWPEKE